MAASRLRRTTDARPVRICPIRPAPQASREDQPPSQFKPRTAPPATPSGFVKPRIPASVPGALAPSRPDDPVSLRRFP